jgi:hypothetical protein
LIPEKPPTNSENEWPGQSGPEVLIKSESPERETRKRDLEGAEEIGSRKDLIESETQDRREAPGGKPERVSTKEAAVP